MLTIGVMNNLLSFLEKIRGHAPLVCIDGESGCHTYLDLLKQFDQWRLRLDQLEVQPGKVVGVRADYSIYSIAVLLALFARGAVVALVPRDGDTERYLVDAHATAFLDLLLNGEYEWRSEIHPTEHPLLKNLRAAGDGGLVIFTSGSTGCPKAALHSVERFLHKFSKPCRRFRTLAFLVLDHIAGLDTAFYTLSGAGALVVTRRRDPESILDLVETYKVEVLPTSPSFLRMLCATSGVRDRDLASLKIVTYGSEIMDPTTLARLQSRLPRVEISQKYGSTETGSPRSVSRTDDSLWIKFKAAEVETKIVDGILWMRSQSTILGYLNAKSPLDEEGWFCTNDLVDIDGEWMRFRGRVTDLINVGGEKVAPAEVEQVIMELEFVREVAIAGEPHPLVGQVVAARIALRNESLDEKEARLLIRAHCRSRLAPHKVPAKIEITTEIGVNVRQKIQRMRS